MLDKRDKREVEVDVEARVIEEKLAFQVPKEMLERRVNQG